MPNGCKNAEARRSNLTGSPGRSAAATSRDQSGHRRSATPTDWRLLAAFRSSAGGQSDRVAGHPAGAALGIAGSDLQALLPQPRDEFAFVPAGARARPYHPLKPPPRRALLMLAPLPHPAAALAGRPRSRRAWAPASRPAPSRFQRPEPEALLELPAGSLRPGAVVVDVGLAPVLGHQRHHHVRVGRSAGGPAVADRHPAALRRRWSRRRTASLRRIARTSRASAHRSARTLRGEAPASNATRARPACPPAARSATAGARAGGRASRSARTVLVRAAWIAGTTVEVAATNAANAIASAIPSADGRGVGGLRTSPCPGLASDGVRRGSEIGNERHGSSENNSSSSCR